MSIPTEWILLVISVLTIFFLGMGVAFYIALRMVDK
jgi:hypothetical protein